jgi:pimeloyl-ACP methyl ester carboxylesterase
MAIRSCCSMVRSARSTAASQSSCPLPSLLIIGDADIVPPEHTVELFRLLGGGVPGDLVGIPRAQLAVLPGTSHEGVLDRVDWLRSMIIEFLHSSTSLGA